MLRSVLLRAATFLVVAAVAAPAAAEIRDVRVGVDGARAEITIAFDAPPTGTAAAPGGNGIMVFADGVAAAPRLIETAGGALVRSIEVREGEGGVELNLELTSEAAAARAWVEGRALRIAVTLTGAEGGAPVGAPAASQGAFQGASLGYQSHQSAAAQNGAPVDGLAGGTDFVQPTASGAAPTTGAPTTGAPATQTAAISGAPPAAQDAAVVAAAEAPRDDLMSAPAPANAIVAPPLRAGGETTPSAASPDPADSIAPEIPTVEPSDATAEPQPRDIGRPSVIYAGGVTEDDCEAADTIVRADPWDLDALRRYAGCRAVDGDLPGAESAFRRLLTITPDDREAELGLGAVLHEKGDLAAAAEIYQRQLASANGDAQAARLRALMALATTGR